VEGAHGMRLPRRVRRILTGWSLVERVRPRRAFAERAWKRPAGRSLHGLVLGLALVGGLGVYRVPQQTRVVIGSRPACPDCVLGLERVVTLGTESGPGALMGEPREVHRDSRGRYYVTQYGDQATILVFDSLGRYQELLGKEGGGPREFGGIRATCLTRGDSLLVFDVRNARLSVWAPDLTLVRTARVPFFVESCHLLQCLYT